MVFIHDTRQSLAAAADLVNTLPTGPSRPSDTLSNVDELRDFLAERPYSGRLRLDAEELGGTRGIRERLRALWSVDRDGAVPLVNDMLVDGRALPQLVTHAGFEEWHVHATHPDAPLHVRMLVETAMAFVDVIRADEFGRVRVCSAEDCSAVYVDYSRNGSKRYCDVGNCGNRMNVNAYRRRKAGGTDE